MRAKVTTVSLQHLPDMQYNLLFFSNCCLSTMKLLGPAQDAVVEPQRQTSAAETRKGLS